MAWISRGLLSTSVKAESSFSRACVASSAFWACWLKSVKKMLFFGIRLIRICSVLRQACRESLCDLTADGHHRGEGHDQRERGQDADVPEDQRGGQLVALHHHQAQGLVSVGKRHEP